MKFSCVCRLTILAGLTAVIVQSAVAHDGHGDPLDPYKGPGYAGGAGGQPPVDFESHNAGLLSWIPATHFSDDVTAANDCWGYVSDSGREYAIIGLSHGTGFVDVTDPAEPEIVAFVDGPQSVWRDMKTYADHLYVVTEGGGGIQVIDLSNIDDEGVELVNTVDVSGSGATHNVYINEESGYLYRCGGGSWTTLGLRIYHLEEPANPQFVGEWHDRYAHDVQVVNWTDGPYAGREIAFVFANDTPGGGNPAVDILDVTDKSNIETIAVADYSYPAFSHQGWLSDDRQYLFVGDELNEINYGLTTTTNIIDISDLDNPVDKGTYTNGSNAITHNMFTRGDYLFQANYRSGLRVLDVSDPVDPEEVAFFDTFPEDDEPSFNGLWSNYPYLPSGIVLGSDREKGLFVWQIDLDEAALGDLTGDGVVGGADLGILLSEWGPCDDCGDCPADLTGDCEVGGADLGVLLSNWTP